MGSDLCTQQHSASLFLLACLTQSTKLQVANLCCRKVRRKRNATLFFIEAAVQSVNLVFYIVPNIYILKRPCYFFGHVIFWCGWVRWTCWNTVRPPSPFCPHAASPFPLSADVPAVCCSPPAAWTGPNNLFSRAHAFTLVAVLTCMQLPCHAFCAAAGPFAPCALTLTSRHAAGNSRTFNTTLLSLNSKAKLSGHCTAVQLFLLFLVHAYGARTWRKPSESSRRLFAPAEAAFQPPEGQSKLVMDGPWRMLWPCLVPWALMQAPHSVAWLRNATASGKDRSATSVLSISIGMGTFRV